DLRGDVMCETAPAVLRLPTADKMRSNSSSGSDRRYAVTSEHPYFSEYEVPARVYRLLYRMLKEELTLSSIAEQDREILHVLYEKGIISISYPCENILRMALDPRKSARINKASIREHVTNTTPTCLSSYLKQ